MSIGNITLGCQGIELNTLQVFEGVPGLINCVLFVDRDHQTLATFSSKSDILVLRECNNKTIKSPEEYTRLLKERKIFFVRMQGILLKGSDSFIGASLLHRKVVVLEQGTKISVLSNPDSSMYKAMDNTEYDSAVSSFQKYEALFAAVVSDS